MDIKLILEQLKAQRSKLDLAIRALEGINSNGASPKTTTKTRSNGRGNMSPAARARLSKILKQRWAERRLKQAKATKKK